MNKLTIEHLAGHLPFKLKCKITGSQRSDVLIADEDYEFRDKYKLSKTYELHSLNKWSGSFVESLEDADRIMLGDITLEFIKPILHPLSDLSKYCEEAGCCPEEFFDSIERDILSLIKDSNWINELPQWQFNTLVKWHFDVDGLIEKGLAIDINTLTK